MEAANLHKYIYGLIISVFSFSIYAASLQVTPVNIFFEQNEKAKAVYLGNSGKKDIRAQLRLFHWDQENGKDVLSDTHDLVVSPPLAQIPAGKTQLVRLLMMQSTSENREQSWRLIVDELPPVIGGDSSSDNQINFLLRYSVPIFTGAVLTPDISMIHVWQENGRLWVKNDNQVHIKLSNVKLLRGSQTVTVTSGLMGYVLAGKEMSWPLEARLPGIQKVEFSLNDDEKSKQLPLISH